MKEPQHAEGDLRPGAVRSLADRLAACRPGARGRLAASEGRGVAAACSQCGSRHPVGGTRNYPEPGASGGEAKKLEEGRGERTRGGGALPPPSLRHVGRVHFSVELLQPWLRDAEDELGTFEYFVRLDLSTGELTEAAESWLQNLTAVLERPRRKT